MDLLLINKVLNSIDFDIKDIVRFRGVNKIWKFVIDKFILAKLSIFINDDRQTIFMRAGKQRINYERSIKVFKRRNELFDNRQMFKGLQILYFSNQIELQNLTESEAIKNQIFISKLINFKSLMQLI